LAGDRVLAELGKRARELTRATDLPCRWGGEEFLILMPNTGPQDALAVAEKIRFAFASQPIVDIGLITASFGVATYVPKESLDDWLTRADDAMYEVKQSGRNAVKIRF
jgi:diguanylate cyclase (GGDEF)-like protein